MLMELSARTQEWVQSLKVELIRENLFKTRHAYSGQQVHVNTFKIQALFRDNLMYDITKKQTAFHVG